MREGFIACHAPGCQNPEAAVTETPTGTFSITCHRCRISSFAKKGTKAHAAILALIDPASNPEQKPEAKPVPESKTPPTPPKKKQGFDLSQLV